MQLTEQERKPAQLKYPGEKEQSGENELRQRRQLKFSSTTWRFILGLGDNLMIILSSIVTLQLIIRLPITNFLTFSGISLFSLCCLVIVSWNIAATLTQSYDLINATSRLRSILCVLLALLFQLAIAALLILSFVLHDVAPSLVAISCFLGISLLILCLWRVAFATYMQLPRFYARSVIVGLNKSTDVLVQELEDVKGLRLNLLGYIDDRYSKQVHATNGLPVLGGREALRRMAHTGLIDTIILAADYRSDGPLFQEALDAAQSGISVLPITTIYERISNKLPVEHIGDQWHASLPLEKNTAPFYLCWQKVLETLFGLIGLVALIVAMPILAPLIYLDSPGPIFYTQERIGYQGRKFRIYKFRSMHMNSEGKGWTKQRDSRVTRVGALLRPTHLDELPQVLNILRGDMTLIGPRPERPEYVSKLETSIPFYRARLNAKPGLTGWAQVKYRYGNTDQDALIKLQYDLYYIKHKSFMLDILIVLMTVIEVVFLRGL